MMSPNRAKGVSMRVFLFVSVLVLPVLIPNAPASAHPGGLNAAGCHNDRKNGGYHCHRGSNASGASTARRSLSSGNVSYFANCSAARAAGAAPVRIGDPGYSRRLDRDGDGVGCE
jgi:hypothetical protein